MLLATNSAEFSKVRSVNSTATSFASKIPTRTEPAGDAGTAGGASVLTMRSQLGPMENHILVCPYGTGDDNDVFAMRIIGWKALRFGYANVLWVPVTLLELTCTMGASVGVANSAIVAAERFCDTLVGVTNKFNDDVTVSIFSPADDTIAHARLDMEGFSKIEFTFDATTGDPTDMNCLYAQL